MVLLAGQRMWHQVKEKAALQYWASNGDRMRKTSQGTKTQGQGALRENCEAEMSNLLFCKSFLEGPWLLVSTIQNVRLGPGNRI